MTTTWSISSKLLSASQEWTTYREALMYPSFRESIRGLCWLQGQAWTVAPLEGNGSRNSLMGKAWQIYIYLRGCNEAKHILFTSSPYLCSQSKEWLNTSKERKMIWIKCYSKNTHIFSVYFSLLWGLEWDKPLFYYYNADKIINRHWIWSTYLELRNAFQCTDTSGVEGEGVVD